MRTTPVGRRVVCIGGISVLLSAVAACAGNRSSETASVAASSQTQEAEGKPSAEPTEAATVPEWRPASEVSQTPDLPSRGIEPTAASSGKQVELYGLTLTVPEETSTREWTNERGLPMTTVMLAGDGVEYPYLVVSHVASSGSTLEEESYTQELMLAGPGREDTYVARTPESWPVSSETADAYMMTWTHAERQEDGASVTTDRAAFFIADGATGRWRIVAVAQPGDLTEDSLAWRTMLTTTID